MKKFRQIGAIIVVVLLLSMYVVCFIAAVSGGEKAQTIFKVTLGMTVALPILLYIFILFLRMAKNRQENPLPVPPEEQPEVPEEQPEEPAKDGGPGPDAP
nr:hypothetical protein [Lachnospiraceae bacterium]